jgi:glycosyltransferase involved in cell wall biosynthesis
MIGLPFFSHIRQRLFKSFVIETRSPQLLVDVSILWRSDAGTGIQRVVRALSEQLLQSNIGGYRLHFVAATRRQPYRYLVEDDDGTGAGVLRVGGRISITRGDIFLGLDLSSRILPRHHRQVRAWRRKGVQISIVVYDLLPARNPEWFNDRQALYFTKWLRFVGLHADQALCISRSVAQDLRAWLQQEGGAASRNDIEICAFPLGGDLRRSRPSHGINEAEVAVLGRLEGRKFVLIVGTIEPRKGHAVALNAFDHLFHTGADDVPILVIVGRMGWKSDEVKERIISHPKNGDMVFWFDDASDELLDELYRKCVGVLFPTFAEGFGLPIVESLSHGKPVLVRDIDVFKEFSSPLITYFQDDTGAGLSNSITEWLGNIENREQPCQQDVVTWQKSCEALLHHLSISA